MGDDAALWDEFNPVVYRAKVRTSIRADGRDLDDEKTVSFGMRRIEARGTQFHVNGRPVFLRLVTGRAATISGDIWRPLADTCNSRPSAIGPRGFRRRWS